MSQLISSDYIMKSDESSTFDELRNLFDRRRAIESASNCKCENGSKSSNLKLSGPGKVVHIRIKMYSVNSPHGS